MAASNFSPSLALVLSFEGGFVNDPKDPGGATCWGVTLDTLSAWRGVKCSVADVRCLTRAAVGPIYAKRYWSPIQGDTLPAGLDLLTFDAAVNQGVGAATRMLQRAVGVADDGDLGPTTLAAIKSLAPAELIEKLQTERINAYRLDAGFSRFGAGWLRRVNSMAATGLAWTKRAA